MKALFTFHLVLDEQVRKHFRNPTVCLNAFSFILYTAPDPPDFLSRYFREDGTDYEEQTFGVNLIDNEIISEINRIVCYNQAIYDDMRLEVSEYAGLMLGIDEASVLTEVQPMYSFSAIQIVDNDSKCSLIL